MKPILFELGVLLAFSGCLGLTTGGTVHLGASGAAGTAPGAPGAPPSAAAPHLSNASTIEDRCADLEAALASTAAAVDAAASAPDPHQAMAAYVAAFRAVGEATQARQPPNGKPIVRSDLALKIVASALELEARSGIPFYASDPGPSPRFAAWFEGSNTPPETFACATAATGAYFNRIATANDALVSLATIVAGAKTPAKVGDVIVATGVPLQTLGETPTAVIRIQGELTYVNCRTTLDGINHPSNCDQVFGPDRGRATVTITDASALSAPGVPTLEPGDAIDFVARLVSVSPKRDRISVALTAITRVRRHDTDLYPYFSLAELR